MKASVVVEAVDVWKKYGDREALRGVSITVGEKEIVSLLGPNGAGKTTLISIIVGVLKQTRGKVLVCGGDPKKPEVRARIGFCPQEHGLIEELTGYENMLFYARLYGIDGEEAKKRIRNLLETVGLWEHARRIVGKYSGGMKKRLSLAITLLPDPQLLVLDEPTVGMDPGVRREVWDIIRNAKRDGKSVLLATHYMDEADILSDRVYIMHEGRVVAHGSPEELKEKYGPPSVIEVELARAPPGLGEALSKLVGEHVIVGDTFARVHSRSPEEDVPRIVAEIHRMGGEITCLRVAKPTLEDVFLKLTGRRLVE